MKHLYPTYRGENGNGQVVMDMVDRFGHTLAQGVGADRVQAQIAARKNTPPKHVVRSILSYAKDHPMRSAFLAATAYHTYRSFNRIKDGGGGSVGIGTLVIASVVAFVGFKILGMFIKDE